MPAPRPPGFQPGVAHENSLNASVARGDTIKAEAAEMLSSYDWLGPMVITWVTEEEWRSKAVKLNVTSAVVEEENSL